MSGQLFLGKSSAATTKSRQRANRSPTHHTMDAPPLPDWTGFTSATTLELAEAVLAQYQANARLMKAIIAVMKTRPEPPAQSSPAKSSPAAFSRGAVPPALCPCCGQSQSPEFPFLRQVSTGGESSKRRRLELGDFCVTDNNTPSQPTQGTPPRQHIMRQQTMRRSPSASPPAAQSESDSGWGKTHSIH